MVLPVDARFQGAPGCPSRTDRILRSPERVELPAHSVPKAAHWASWAGCIQVRRRHTSVAEMLIFPLEDDVARCEDPSAVLGRCPHGLSFLILVQSSRRNRNPAKGGLATPCNHADMTTVHPRRDLATVGRSAPRFFFLRPQSGPLAAAPFTALHTSRGAKIGAQPCRRLSVCKRLQLPLPLTLRDRQLDTVLPPWWGVCGG